MDERVLIIVPTYNERENIEVLVPRIFAVVPHVNVLIVDDSSPDGTGAAANALAADDVRVHVLARPHKRGLGAAYRDGFRWALSKDYDTVIEMDADLSHDPSYLPRLLDTIAGGADLVIGSRRTRGGGTENWGMWRRAISAGGNIYASTILGVDVGDLTAGFKAFRRRVLETLDLEAIRSEGYSFQIEMTYRTLRAGFRVVEIPIVFVDRRVGQSKLSRRIFVEALYMVWFLRLGIV